jgi:hypothetical protein
MARRFHLMIVCAAICASPLLTTSQGKAAGFAPGQSSVRPGQWFGPISSPTPFAFRGNDKAPGRGATKAAIGTLPRVLVGSAPQAAAFHPATRRGHG